jgi:Phytanoyl-CoA dioxygenase (PhyH)
MDDLGYGIVEGVFSGAELAPVVAALDGHVTTRSRAGARHVLALPEIRALAGDPRLMDLAARFVGSAQPFRATLFDKSASANWLVAWHQDTALPMRAQADAAGWGPWSTKAGILYAHAPASALERVVALRVSLDPSTDANGPLRVLPGTHVHGLLDDAAVERLAREVSAIGCTVGAGGVVAMRPLLLHASSKSTSDARRRALHIEYASAAGFGPGLDLAVG